ncbi:hypothetical protein C7M84_007238 [Penaeus vannamei]|uniref:Uncharacterized protein n=1 Tax=Penaeus vannamei TaxID=6689 RepID=A0A423TCT7_PENVA|nr:hypothetical protein C7M84_007238 [Penaeus vannamei]
MPTPNPQILTAPLPPLQSLSPPPSPTHPPRSADTRLLSPPPNPSDLRILPPPSLPSPPPLIFLPSSCIFYIVLSPSPYASSFSFLFSILPCFFLLPFYSPSPISPYLRPTSFHLFPSPFSLFRLQPLPVSPILSFSSTSFISLSLIPLFNFSLFPSPSLSSLPFFIFLFPIFSFSLSSLLLPLSTPTYSYSFIPSYPSYLLSPHSSFSTSPYLPIPLHLLPFSCSLPIPFVSFPHLPLPHPSSLPPLPFPHRSIPLTSSSLHLPVAEKRMGDVSTPPVPPLVVVFLGLVGGFVLLLLLGILLTRVRSNRCSCLRHEGRGDTNAGGIVSATGTPTNTTTKSSSSAHATAHTRPAHTLREDEEEEAPDVLRTVNETAQLLEGQICPEVIPVRQPPPYSHHKPLMKEGVQLGPGGVGGLYREPGSPRHLPHDELWGQCSFLPHSDAQPGSCT